MNVRENFYRLQHWQLAERQRHVTDLESLEARLRAEVERLREEIDEAGGAEAALDRGLVFPLFVRPLLDRRDKLGRSIAEIEAQLVEARAAVTAAAQEVKLTEGTLAHRGLKFEDRPMRRVRSR